MYPGHQRTNHNSLLVPNNLDQHLKHYNSKQKVNLRRRRQLSKGRSVKEVKAEALAVEALLVAGAEELPEVLEDERREVVDEDGVYQRSQHKSNAYRHWTETHEGTCENTILVTLIA